jgi:hypothetical protein
MASLENPICLGPKEFELAVKGILDAAGALARYESVHLESIAAQRIHH